MQIDPNIAALLGAGGGNSDFMTMLMHSINPNAAGDLKTALGGPNASPLLDLAASAPSIKTADPQPALAGPQMLQTLGFGMAGAAGAPGSTGLSSMGVGGTNVIKEGGAASERATREAAQENNAAIAEWSGKSKLAEDVLGQQMKEPELDMKMMDLTGATMAREEARRDNSLYRAGLLENGAGRIGVSQQNADTAGVRAKTGQQRADTGQQRADTYDESVTGNLEARKRSDALHTQQLDQRATEFQQRLLEDAKSRGQRLGLDVAQRAAAEFKNEMTLRKNPITGELPDDATQQALHESIMAKYVKAAAPPSAGGTAGPDDALAQAKDAIRAGADPMKVKARLVQMGVDPAGLGP